MYKKISLSIFATAVLLAGCGPNNPTNSAMVRTVGGAGIGALVADKEGEDRTKGALIGAVAGGASCGLTGCY